MFWHFFIERVIREKDTEIQKLVSTAVNQESKTKDLEQKREIEQLQAEENIRKKGEEISKLQGLLQNLEIETKDLRYRVEENKPQTIQTTEEKEEETEMKNKIESNRKDFLMNIVAPPRQVTEQHGKIIQGTAIF